MKWREEARIECRCVGSVVNDCSSALARCFVCSVFILDEFSGARQISRVDLR